MDQTRLPSWRVGATRDAIESFLDAAEIIPVEQRVAVFDNDGTLWCEKPRYVQLEFYLRELRASVGERPELAVQTEYRAVLDDDGVAIGRLGPVNVVLALAELHAGMTPEAFDARVRAFFRESSPTGSFCALFALPAHAGTHRRVACARLLGVSRDR